MRIFSPRLLVVLLLALALLPASAALNKLSGYAETFGLAPEQVAKAYAVQAIDSSAPAHVLWPGETASFTLQFTNKTDAPIDVTGSVEVIRYGTETLADVFSQRVFKLADAGKAPMRVTLPAKGYVNVVVKPALPDLFGPFALVVDLPGYGRQLAVLGVRVLPATPGRVQHPAYALDCHSGSVQEITLFKRLGIKGVRMELGYFPVTSRDFYAQFARLAAGMKYFQDNDITVMITAGGGGPQPLGMAPRTHLDDKGVMVGGKGDYAWLPASDDDYQQWVKILCGTFGWPRGPLNAIELWNEPWEGRSISGWGADMLRYRELYTRMAQGVEEARKERGAQVLIGGTCSSMNTFDKLFPDGSDAYLKWLDFTSIHYQPMGAVPALVPEWMTRKSPNGPVRVWDTESWIANSEDRVAAVIASMRAQGQSRTAGVFHDATREIQRIRYQSAAGLIETTVVQPLAPAAAIAATQCYLGERTFKELLFKNGLPWVFVFNGLPQGGKPNPDDGTLVVVGDLGGVYERDGLLFRTVLGTKNGGQVAAVKAKLAALPADAPVAERKALQMALTQAGVLAGAAMTFPNPGGKYTLYDFYGNPVASKGGQLVVPLDGLGYFLRTDGTTGSFAELLTAVAGARVDGLTPLEIVAHDLTGRIEARPALRLTLTNVLNRPVTGVLSAKLGALTLEPAAQAVAFAPFETKDVTLAVTGGNAAPDNSYPLAVRFDAGADGVVAREEILHVNLIAKRTITVDGKLDDWKDALPQPVAGKDTPNPNLTEKAWFPFEKLETPAGKGFGIGYLAYDERNFYFAAKIADNTPYDGTVRYATRDDDQYFYPETSYYVDGDRTLEKREVTWPLADARALLKPGEKTRSTAGWESTVKAFAIELKFTDTQPHQVALYCVDPDELGRRGMWIEVQDADTGKVLDRREMSRCVTGKYLVLHLAGNIRLKFTSVNGLSAVVSGIFFDPATPVRPLKGTAAAYVKYDETTQGNWPGVYGADGHHVIGCPTHYPAAVQVTVPAVNGTQELKWPEGVRRFSYRKGPDLPSGGGTDNVLIAFNALPLGQDGWYPNPPGTMPRFMNYRDTDYEFALNKVAPQYGGGTEIWRLFAPGMPRKHFYPRQPKFPGEGPVADGQLSVVHDGATRIVECALPWSAVPDVKRLLDAGAPVKFSFRVNDNGRIPAYELAMGRSVSKLNNYAFHNDWESAWANEVEFAFEK
jgi:hypothetical protein